MQLAAATLAGRFVVASGVLSMAAAMAASREAALAVANANASQASTGCSWVPPSPCASAFTYGGQSYSGCCTAGTTDNTAWCSHSATYEGSSSPCTWSCQEVPQGSLVMPYANDWSPTNDEVQYLKGEAERLVKPGMLADLKQKQDDAARVMAEAGDAYKVATEKAARAQQKAAVISALEEQEAKRVAALPALARMAQQQAIVEHEKRKVAETQVVEARQLRENAEKTQGDSLVKLHQAVSKQRLVNRIRAAEDARIANAALQSAMLARSELAAKQKLSDTVNAAVEKALSERRDASILAGQALVNATADLTKQVTTATAEMTQQDTVMQNAKYDLLKLQYQAEQSQKDAVSAQSKAYEDRARADAAIVASKLLKKSADCEDDKLDDTTGALKTAKDQQVEDESVQTAKISAKEKAELKAFKAQDKAVKNLEEAATVYGDADSGTKSYVKMAQIRPEGFIGGVANGITGKNTVRPKGAVETVEDILGKAKVAEIIGDGS